MLFRRDGHDVHHGDRSLLRAEPRFTLGYHREEHHHHTVIRESKPDRAARLGLLVALATLAYENREALAEHGGRLLRATQGALKGWAQRRLGPGTPVAEIEEAELVAEPAEARRRS